MLLRFLTAGESHGPALTVIVEGLPAGLAIDMEGIRKDLLRRRSGYGRGGRMKIETAPGKRSRTWRAPCQSISSSRSVPPSSSSRTDASAVP